MIAPGTKIRLPDAPVVRKGAKPAERYGVVVEPPYDLDGYVFVEKCDRVGRWWVPVGICTIISGEAIAQ